MSPAFRFKLIRKKERIFEAQRFCFRGGIEDWISLHHEGTLDELCQYYLKHLGKESFYELMQDGQVEKEKATATSSETHETSCKA